MVVVCWLGVGCVPLPQHEESFPPRLDLQALLESPPRHEDVAAHDGGESRGGGQVFLFLEILPEVDGCESRQLDSDSKVQNFPNAFLHLGRPAACIRGPFVRIGNSLRLSHSAQ